MAASMVAFASPARGQPVEAHRAEARLHYARGVAEYNLRHFDAAIVEFQAAYRLRSDPAFLFNLGQTYRLIGRLQDALFSYQRYLVAEPDGRQAADARNRVEEIKRALARPSDLPTSPAGPAPAPEPALATPVESGPPSASALHAQPPAIVRPRPTEGSLAGAPIGPAPASSFVVTVAFGVSRPEFPSPLDPTIPTVAIAAVYRRGTSWGAMEAGLAFSYGRFSYAKNTSGEGTSQFPELLATVAPVWRLSGRWEVSAQAGGGVTWWTGLEGDNPFTFNGVAASGAVPMATLRGSLSARLRLGKGFFLAAEPGYQISFASSGLKATIPHVRTAQAFIHAGFLY